MFEVKASDLQFYGPAEGDFCSHGHIFMKVGDTVISDETDGNWVINEAAFMMMWTVKYGAPFQQFPEYYVDKETFIVNCCGCLHLFCNSGIRWKVVHEGDLVHLSEFIKYSVGGRDDSAEGLYVTMPLAEYAKAIYAFAVEALRFHEAVENRIDEDELFPGQIATFWREYYELLAYVGEVANV